MIGGHVPSSISFHSISSCIHRFASLAAALGSLATACTPRSIPSMVATLPTTARASCDLPVETCVILLRGHVSTLENEHYKAANLEDVCKNYETFLVSCAAITNRLTVAVIEKATCQLFGKNHERNRLFAQRLSAAFSHCVKKSSQCTSGSKLSPAVKHVVDVLNKKSQKSPTKDISSQKTQEPLLKRQLLVSTPPAASTSSSSSAATIYALYASPTAKPTPALPTPLAEPLQVLSSQEISDSSQKGEVVVPACGRGQKRFVDWVDFAAPVPRMRRLDTSDGTQQDVELTAGPAGFAIARFSDGEVATEVPNLLLVEPPVPRKKPAAAQKKPAAHEDDEVEEEEEQEPPVGPEEEQEQEPPVVPEVEPAEEVAGIPPSMTYSKLWYKNNNAFGIRQKIMGKTQIFTVGGKGVKQSKTELAAIADRVIKMMEEESVPEDAGKEWAKSQVIRPLSID